MRLYLCALGAILSGARVGAGGAGSIARQSRNQSLVKEARMIESSVSIFVRTAPHNHADDRPPPPATLGEIAAINE